MAVESKLLPGEPILSLRFVPPHNPLPDSDEMMQIVFETAENAIGPLYLIVDISQPQISFSDVVAGMSSSRGNLPDQVKASALIGTSEMVNLIAHASGQEQYGQRNIQVFPTFDGALDYIRSLIA